MGTQLPPLSSPQTDAFLRSQEASLKALQNIVGQLIGSDNLTWFEVMKLLDRLGPEVILERLKSLKMPIWKKITSADKSKVEMIRRFAERLEVKDDANEALLLPEVDAPVPDTFSLVKGSLFELFGFAKERHIQDFLDEPFLEDHSLQFCCPFDVFHAGGAYTGEPDGRSEFCGCRPIHVADNESVVPSLRIGQKIFVDAALARPEDYAGPEEIWFFRRLEEKED